MNPSSLRRAAHFALHALPWLALSAAAVLSERCWEHVLPMAYYTWSEPSERVARITASAKPPVTLALVALRGIAATVLVSSVLGASSKSAGRARAALGWLGAHTLVLLTAMVVSSPLKTQEQLLAAGIIRMREAYSAAYAAGLCLWQAWAGAAFVLLALLVAPWLWWRAGATHALRMVAASLLVLAPFSFAWMAGDWSVWIVVGALPLWVAAELLATRSAVEVWVF